MSEDFDPYNVRVASHSHLNRRDEFLGFTRRQTVILLLSVIFVSFLLKRNCILSITSFGIFLIN